MTSSLGREGRRERGGEEKRRERGGEGKRRERGGEGKGGRGEGVGRDGGRGRERGVEGRQITHVHVRMTIYRQVKYQLYSRKLPAYIAE